MELGVDALTNLVERAPSAHVGEASPEPPDQQLR